MPGQAAYDALAGAMYPNRRPHALIDKLVIAGLAAESHITCWLRDNRGRFKAMSPCETLTIGFDQLRCVTELF